MESLLASMVVSAISSNENYEVISCNHETSGVSREKFIYVHGHVIVQRPALSFRIAQAYFENNLSNTNEDYTLNNGFYERSIEESDLDFAFDDSNDRKYISI